MNTTTLARPSASAGCAPTPNGTGATSDISLPTIGGTGFARIEAGLEKCGVRLGEYGVTVFRSMGVADVKGAAAIFDYIESESTFRMNCWLGTLVDSLVKQGRHAPQYLQETFGARQWRRARDARAVLSHWTPPEVRAIHDSGSRWSVLAEAATLPDSIRREIVARAKAGRRVTVSDIEELRGKERGPREDTSSLPPVLVRHSYNDSTGAGRAVADMPYHLARVAKQIAGSIPTPADARRMVVRTIPREAADVTDLLLRIVARRGPEAVAEILRAIDEVDEVEAAQAQIPENGGLEEAPTEPESSPEAKSPLDFSYRVDGEAEREIPENGDLEAAKRQDCDSTGGTGSAWWAGARPRIMAVRPLYQMAKSGTLPPGFPQTASYVMQGWTRMAAIVEEWRAGTLDERSAGGKVDVWLIPLESLSAWVSASAVADGTASTAGTGGAHGTGAVMEADSLADIHPSLIGESPAYRQYVAQLREANRESRERIDAMVAAASRAVFGDGWTPATCPTMAGA